MGMPQVKAIGTFTGGASNSVTVPWPTHAVGDLALLVVSGARNSGLTAISGWTLCGSGRASSGPQGSDNAITVFYRVATSASEASPVWTHSSGVLSGQIITFTDYNPADPVTTFSRYNGGSYSGALSVAGNTTAADNALFVLAFVDANLTADNVLSVDNGFSIIAEGNNSGSNGFSQYVATKEMPTAGTTGTTVIDFDAISNAGIQSISINGSPTSPIVGDSSFSLTAGSSVLSGAGALLASTALVMTPAATLSGAGALQGSTSLSFGHGPSYLFGTHAAEGSGSLVTLDVPNATLGGLGQMVGSAGLSLDTTATGDTFEGSSASTTLQLTTSGVLTGAGRLIGTTNGLFTLMGTGNGYADMAGNASITLVPLGTLTVVFNPIFGQTFRDKWAAVFDAKQALLNAAAAQARGLDDEIIDTYFDAGMPYDGAIADLWRETGTSTLYRWDGSVWVAEPVLAEGTADDALTIALAEPANVAAIADGRIRSYWRSEPPVIGAGGASEGDVWFDTDDGTAQLIWDGTGWVGTAAGANIYAQDDEPTGTIRVGDIWIDTNDGNKMRRWDGDAWVDVTDTRVSAAAAAVTELLNRVSATEDTLESQALSITNLSSQLSDTQGELDALATANETLETQVTSIAGSKATVFAQATTPSTSGRVNGDLWIDTDDGNRMYVWDGAWTLCADTNGLKIFAQTTAPSSVGRQVGDLWFDTDDNNRQYRWDGSAWLDVTDQRIISQASQITTLQSQVALLPVVYVQDTPPPGSTYAVGDIWFDSDDGNRQYIWDGSIWGDTSTISGAVVYAQTAEPTGGAYNIGDLWIDLDDGNRLYRWNGAAWVDVSDQRMVGQASAISALTTRVEATEGAITSQAGQITTLNSAVAAKTRTFVQASAPTATAIGDVWIDSDDNNKLYAWDGTSWVLRRLEAGASTYAQNEPPATGNLGDLWVDLNDSNKLYRWNGTSWILVTDGRIASQGTAISNLETRTSTAEGTIATHTGQITSLNASLATKPRIYADPAQPTGAVVGDLWIDTDDSNKLYTWNGSGWIYRPIPTGAKVYRQPTAPGTGVNGDLWFDSDDGNKPYIWSGGGWVDNTDSRTAANASAVSALNASVAQKTKTFVQGTAPSTDDRTIGDVWIDTSNGNLLKAWNGSTWAPYADANKIKTYAQTAAPTGGTYAVGDLWIDTDDNNLLYRWNGSNWVSVADVRISAQASQITALTAEVAGKASATALETLRTQVETVEGIFGVNLIPNSGFAVDARGWAVAWDQLQDQANEKHVYGRDLYGSTRVVPGTHNLGVGYSGTTPSAHHFAIGMMAEQIPIVAGESYILSCGLSKTAGIENVFFYMQFFNAGGGQVGSDQVLGFSGTGYTGGTNRANWYFSHLKVVAPTGAVRAALYFRPYFLAGLTNPGAWVMEPMLERAAPGQNVPSPFNLGPTAAWAEWDLSFDVNGNVGGISYGIDGSVSNFKVRADSFEVVTGTGGTGLTLDQTRMDRVFSAIATYEGNPFGPDDLIYWTGPSSITKANATIQNAIFCVANNGGSYFGGSLNPGYIVNGERTTNTANNASITLGPFLTYGASKQVTVGYSWRNIGNTVSGNQVSTYNNKLFTATVAVESSTNGYSWTPRGTINASAYSVAEYDLEQNITMVWIGLVGSLQYTDNSAQTANMHVRATLTSRETPWLLSFPDPPQQLITIKTVE